MVVWPGDPPFELRAARRIARGDGSNVSTLTLSTHLGTHVDAPWHFESDGAQLHELDASLYFGEAEVIDLTGVEGQIRAERLPERRLPERVLFKTRNSMHGPLEPFRKDYVALELDAAERLVRDGTRLVGVDYLSVAPYKQPGQATHHCLLRNGIIVVEGLRLLSIPAGVHAFVVLPLPLMDADGSPCRAFVGREE